MANLASKVMYPSVPPSVQVTNMREAGHQIENLRRHLMALSTHADLQDTVFRSQFLVEGSDIESLAVDKLTAGTIGVDGILVGTGIELAGLSNRIKVGANDNIIVDGTFNNIQVYDNQASPQLRVVLGQQGANSNVLKFNGISTNVDLGVAAFGTGNTYVIEAQFKCETLPSAEGREFVVMVQNNKFEIKIKTNDEIALWDYNGAANRDTGVTVQANRWYHVFAYISNGTGLSDVWVDGEQVLTDFAYNDVDDLGTTYIGGKASSNWFEGWIREVRYHDAPITVTAAHVKSLDIQNRPSTVNPLGVEHEYRLDEGTGGTANDNKGSVNGTINNGTWETIDNNYGLRMMDEDGQVFFHVSDKVYINGGALINQSVDGEKMIDASIVDAKIANIGWAKIDNVAIVDADIVNLSASKINTGTLNAAVVTVTNLSAASISAGTLTVDGSPSITVTSGGVVLFNNGADLRMRAASASDNTAIELRSSGNVVKGKLRIVDSNETTQLANDIGNSYFELLNTGDIARVQGAGHVELGLISTSSIQFIGGIDSNFDPADDKIQDMGIAGLKAWDTINADDFNNVADIGFSNGYIICETDKAYKDVPPEAGLVIQDDEGRILGVLAKDKNLYIQGEVKNIKEWEYYGSRRNLSSLQKKQITKYANSYHVVTVTDANGKVISRKRTLKPYEDIEGYRVKTDHRTERKLLKKRKERADRMNELGKIPGETPLHSLPIKNRAFKNFDNSVNSDKLDSEKFKYYRVGTKEYQERKKKEKVVKTHNKLIDNSSLKI